MCSTLNSGCVSLFNSEHGHCADNIQDLTHFEAVVAALFYQFTLYIALRLAHRGFTLGELGLVCFGGTALCLESLNMTISRVGVQWIRYDSTDISSLLDMAYNDAVYTNIQVAHSPAHFSDCTYRGIFRHWCPTFSFSRPFSEQRPTPCTPSTFPTRERME